MKIKITGIVQGVGFRPFVYRIAEESHLTGYVLNRGDAGVEILAEGSGANIEAFMHDLKDKKPVLAQLYEIMTTELEGRPEFVRFTIQQSSQETTLSGSVIPPDTAICDDCLRELRNPNDPRFDYFFITCTNCGPRFTIIEKLPYDRENTTMHEFPMCGFCQTEYRDPSNRRFHAQTVACPKCGPKTWLTNRTGETIPSNDPIREAGKLLSEGSILAIKGYGGFHVATSTILDGPLRRVREVKHRSQKPFAIMARSLEAVRTFAELTPSEEVLLTSYQRPIVLVDKTENYALSELVSPGLHNVGVMLPYTGLHYLLFDNVTDEAFVMTSANPPSQPIVKDNDEALRTLGDVVDYFLFHNRRIAYRCDDSVVRLHDESPAFVRRSRGYAPAPITLKNKAEKCVAAFGGELNNTACVLVGDKAFISQHIGDVENIETRSFLEDATNRLIRLTSSEVDTVSCDLHPKFTTTQLAQNLAEENEWQLIRVQHHHAHVAALMAEYNINEIVGVCCDGYGYGLNGEAWGGEILQCSTDFSGFNRVAHLQEQPLVGGDLATRYPVRMAAGILHGNLDIKDWLMGNAHHLPHGEKEVQIVLHELETNSKLVKTTSCGRILDAVAVILGVCHERTYEGEPSMKLEALAMKGKDTLRLTPAIYNNILNTTTLLTQIFQNRHKHSKQDLACSAHAYLAKGLSKLAVQHAIDKGIKAVGFTGGVAYNRIFSSIIRRHVEQQGLEFVIHRCVPPGDGGLSFGQAVASAFFHP
jgi:hydrogenase maturation protein HypF